MNGLTGMEKFSHLEDKIYLTIEYAKKMREEKERAERELAEFKRGTQDIGEERRRMEAKIASLLSERDAIQLKVEAMLDAITIIDGDVAEVIGRHAS
jgi:chromosome segregation ATPase